MSIKDICDVSIKDSVRSDNGCVERRKKRQFNAEIDYCTFIGADVWDDEVIEMLNKMKE